MRRWMLNPRWLALHALTVLLTVAFLALGWWQLRRGESGNFRSYAYALEWPMFALFVVFMWWHVLTDARRPADPDAESTAEPVAEPVAAADRTPTRAPGPAPESTTGSAPDPGSAGTTPAPRRGAPAPEPALPRVLASLERAAPPDAQAEEPDERLAAYNRYLAGLHARDGRRAR